jgi:hypothetical protein
LSAGGGFTRLWRGTVVWRKTKPLLTTNCSIFLHACGVERNNTKTNCGGLHFPAEKSYTARGCSGRARLLTAIVQDYNITMPKRVSRYEQQHKISVL